MKVNEINNVTTVHVNKQYPDNEVRHLNICPGIKSSVSGQYASTNFPELVRRIREAHGDGSIYFVDTRQDTHFELNQRAVTIKTDDNIQKTSEQITEREDALANSLFKTTVLFRGKHMEDTEEEVTSSSTCKQFIENQKYGNLHSYLRFPLDAHGPLTDMQVDTYISLIGKIQDEKAWLHTNTYVSRSAAQLLLVMRDILANAPTESLMTILQKHEKAEDFLKEPKQDDKNASKKIERAAFLKEFYVFAQTRPEHLLSWSEWRKQKQ